MTLKSAIVATPAALRGLAPDGMMLAGIAAISHGAWLIYSPAGWVVAGGFSLGFGVLLARRAEVN